MNVRPAAFVLLALPFAWTTALVISNLSRASIPSVALPLAVCVGIGAYSAVRARYPDLWVGIALGGLALLSIAAGATGVLGWELGTGLLLGIPWILVGYGARNDAPLGVRFIAFGVAVAFGMSVLAARADLGIATGSLTAPTFLRAVYTVVGDQSQVIGSVLNGTAVPALPLLDFFDPVYAGLTAAALLGLCLAAVRPQTGTGVLLPLSIPLHPTAEGGGELPAAYGFSTRQRALFAERTVAEPPLTPWPPGLGCVIWGGLGAALFLIAAYTDPLGAVLVLTLALVAASGAMVVLTEVPGLLRMPARSRRRTRRLWLGTPTPRATTELLTSPSLPVNEPPSPPPTSGG